jgi:hypothetical protein
MRVTPQWESPVISSSGPNLNMSIYYLFIIFSGSAVQRGLWPPRSRGFLITHNDAPQSVGLLWTSDQLVAETSTWQRTTHTTNIHAPGGIQTLDRSRRAAVDLSLRPRGHWDRLNISITIFNYLFSAYKLELMCAMSGFRNQGTEASWGMTVAIYRFKVRACRDVSLWYPIPDPSCNYISSGGRLRSRPAPRYSIIASLGSPNLNFERSAAPLV